MIQKREKRRRQRIRAEWRPRYLWWLSCEPPRWRFISRWLWKKDRPIPPKGVKAVLISIKPRWCNLIAQKKKTVEVRKTKPTLQTPFKCYIYCTKDPVLKFWIGPRYSYTDDHSHNAFDRNGNGKVIGEFVCDVVIDGKMHVQDWVYICENCEVPGPELYAYCGENESGDPNYCFGWNITDLVIYDRPKELSEFTALRKTKFGYEPIPLRRPPQSWCYVEEKS